ncbi:hypothetical protein TRIATDRAFT_93021 [Trichoderma atroviride IMI 206040]|uniref:Uncharacterized protein n=1 Tax=Hypocrea atroviridis (strain ATCC 20476 / IMI 206040) TaxID=452589 RepID=G9NGX0_HYPAI|nr:uncharacterized protein TRIATDRAFT_93021 [Trichoderma atroviride IMI 206040]EHK49868.1 hypothetical protein TRIATDRAFT_93021 [Trichoderma atroviride IMI 206040]
MMGAGVFCWASRFESPGFVFSAAVGAQHDAAQNRKEQRLMNGWALIGARLTQMQQIEASCCDLSVTTQACSYAAVTSRLHPGPAPTARLLCATRRRPLPLLHSVMLTSLPALYPPCARAGSALGLYSAWFDLISIACLICALDIYRMSTANGSKRNKLLHSAWAMDGMHARKLVYQSVVTKRETRALNRAMARQPSPNGGALTYT